MAEAAPVLEFVEPKDYPIYNEYAEKAVTFINGLSHGKVLAKPGEPIPKQSFEGHKFNLRPWQEFKIVRPIFGLVDQFGRRLIQTAFVEIPRKNGKSEIAGGIALKCLAADGEQEGEIYLAASDKEQASIVFNAAAGMVRRNPQLNERCKIIDSKKRIIYKPTNSVMVALSREALSKEGYNASAVVYDEVHAARDRKMWEVLTDSMGARNQPLVFAITTSGFETDSLWGDLREYAFKVRDGEIVDPSFLPILFCAPKDADWHDRKLWKQTNPALGDFKSEEWLEKKYFEAVHIPAAQNRFRRVQLCQETEQDERWLDVALWKSRSKTFDLEKLRGRTVYLGLDLASNRDIAAMVMLIPVPEEKKVYAHAWFFVPKENAKLIKRERLAHIDYKAMVEQGFLIATPGKTINYDYIYDLIKDDINVNFKIGDVEMDRHQAVWLANRLQAEGITVTFHMQSCAAYDAPCKDLEKLLIDDTLVLQDNPVWTWMAGNVSVEEDSQRRMKPVKPPKDSKTGEESKKKIDGIVALLMADSGMNATEPEPDLDSHFGGDTWSL